MTVPQIGEADVERRFVNHGEHGDHRESTEG